MKHLVILIDVLAFNILLDKKPKAALIILNVEIAMLIATCAAVIFSSFASNATSIRLMALASFLAYLTAAYLWVRLKPRE